MPEIRPLQAHDLPVVANMFQRELRRQRTPAPPSLAGYLKRLYFDATNCDVGSPSLVHIGDNGNVSGFVGVTSMPILSCATKSSARRTWSRKS